MNNPVVRDLCLEIGSESNARCNVRERNAYNTTSPAWAELLFHTDLSPVIQAHLCIRALVVLTGTCTEARDAIAFKPAKAKAALIKHGKSLGLITTPGVMSNLCVYAAGEGDLRLLEWAMERGCEKGHQIIDVAARRGDIPMVRFMETKWQTMRATAHLCAARHGQLAFLKWVVARGDTLHDEICDAATIGGHLRCLQYVHAHGGKMDEKTYRLAVQHGHMKMVQWMHAQGCPCDHTAKEVAVFHGQTMCLQFQTRPRKRV